MHHEALPSVSVLILSYKLVQVKRSYYLNIHTFWPLDEAIVYRAVIVVLSGPDGRSETLLESDITLKR